MGLGLTLLDASALIAWARDQAAAAQVTDLARKGNVAIVAVNLAEAMDVLVRRHGLRPSGVAAALRSLTGTTVQVIPLDERSALRAGALRAKHYHRTKRPLSLADCALLASARPGDRIATADRAVLAAAKEEAIEVIRLPADD